MSAQVLVYRVAGLVDKAASSCSDAASEFELAYQSTMGLWLGDAFSSCGIEEPGSDKQAAKYVLQLGLVLWCVDTPG